MTTEDTIIYHRPDEKLVSANPVGISTLICDKYQSYVDAAQRGEIAEIEGYCSPLECQCFSVAVGDGATIRDCDYERIEGTALPRSAIRW